MGKQASKYIQQGGEWASREAERVSRRALRQEEWNGRTGKQGDRRVKRACEVAGRVSGRASNQAAGRQWELGDHEG